MKPSTVASPISIPDELFKRADALAKRLGKSRSELYSEALRDHLSRHGDAAVTARLDAVYTDEALSAEDRSWLDDAAAGVAERNSW